MQVQCNRGARLGNHCRSGKAISIAYSDCVFAALIIQQATRMWPFRLYNVFPHCLTIGKFFGGRGGESYRTSNVRFHFSTPLSETFLIPRRTERDMIKNMYSSSRKLPVILCQRLITFECSRQTFEKYSNINSIVNTNTRTTLMSQVKIY